MSSTPRSKLVALMNDVPEPMVAPARKRKAVSAGSRFEVFKRDRFTCQYCGAHPPGVLLHIDHIVAVASGGTNDLHNLVTACEPCNLGKGARALGHRKPSLKDQAAQAKERERQLAGYQKLLSAQRERLEHEIDVVQGTFTIFHDGFCFTPRFRISVRIFIEKLGVDEVIASMERACFKCQDRGSAMKYFCGTCWGKIREGAI